MGRGATPRAEQLPRFRLHGRRKATQRRHGRHSPRPRCHLSRLRMAARRCSFSRPLSPSDSSPDPRPSILQPFMSILTQDKEADVQLLLHKDATPSKRQPRRGKNSIAQSQSW